MRLTSTIIAVCLAIAALPAAGQVINEDAKLLPSDGAGGDEFGFSVAVSGTMAVVGALFEDDNGSNSGAAYLFDTATGQQIAKLLSGDGAVGDYFGRSVAISGTTALVGAFADDDNGSGSGSAYVFDTTTGQQLAKLLPGDGTVADNFGISVAISGATAVVGAFLDDDNGSGSGSAYVFDATTGQQLFKLLPSDGAVEDRFGYSVAISSTTAVVGAYQDDDNGSNSGSAYLFDTTTGLQIAKLVPGDGAADNRFGISVAISGTTAVVGAQSDDDNGIDSGSAYLFDTVTGQQIAKLIATDGAPADSVGISVAISGTRAVVGAFLDDDNGSSSGSAYLFDTTTGEQIAKLLPGDGAAGDQFGCSVAISGTTAFVGAYADDDNGSSSGSAYLFNLDTDGDGLLDSWETNGIDSNGDGVIDLDLPAMGARVDRKDIFIEIDAMTGRAPTMADLQPVIDAFNQAPVPAPPGGGTGGIALHLVIDETSIPRAPFPNNFADFDTVKAARLGTATERADANWPNIKAAREAAFRFCIFADTYDGSGSSGLAEFPGNDFMVTLGAWAPPGGTPDQKAGTFMHELGHTLGLGHGGGDNTHYKPNYYSVMNYRWQTPQSMYAHLWRLDYSREALPPLVETALDESTSLGATRPEYAAVQVPFTTAANTWGWAPLATGQKVDWNGDGATPAGQPLVMADINRRAPTDPAGGLTTLTSHDDWANLQYALNGHPNFGNGRTNTTIDDEFDVTEFAINEQIPPPPSLCVGDIADDFGTLGADGMVSFGDFLALLGLIGPCPGGTPGCDGDIADDFGTLNGGDGMVSFGDFLALLGLIGPCP